eukprot:scaffold314772_cov19-Tisochrysis_lutea.AAC.3
MLPASELDHRHGTDSDPCRCRLHQAMKARALSKRGLDADGPEWPLKLDGLPAGIVSWAAFRA